MIQPDFPPLVSIAILRDLAATEAFAARIASRLRRTDAILLSGDLGAGKTEFVRALLRTLTQTPNLDVPSPSYTLVQTYDTPIGLVHHYDLWRVQDAKALPELGWEDALTDIVLVEWPDRLGSLTPASALHLHLTVQSADQRQAMWTGWPDRGL